MNAHEFWRLIDLGRQSVHNTVELPSWLELHLKNKSIEDIGQFHCRFREMSCASYDVRLWAAASLIMKFCSDDKFTDFRAWLIGKGQTVFEKAMENPDTLAEVEIDGDYGIPILFKMNYVAERAYRAKAGEMADISDVVPNLPKLVLKNEAAWDGDQNKLSVMFPKLFAKFGK